MQEVTKDVQGRAVHDGDFVYMWRKKRSLPLGSQHRGGEFMGHGTVFYDKEAFQWKVRCKNRKGCTVPLRIVDVLGFPPGRAIVTKGTVCSALRKLARKVEAEVAKKGRGAFMTSAEIVGAVTEEYDEMKEAVHAKNRQATREELYDVAIAAMWGVVSMDAGAGI